MGMRIVIDPGAYAHLEAATTKVVRRLADEVRDDAKNRYVPVREGRLRDSISVEMVDYRTAHIGSDKEYAAPVEMGYHLWLWGVPTEPPRYIPPQPYLRPALYTARRLT